MGNTRKPNKPWLRNVLHTVPKGEKRRTRKGNMRAFAVLTGRVKNGLAACPRCGTVEKGHTLTYSICGPGKDD